MPVSRYSAQNGESAELNNLEMHRFSHAFVSLSWEGESPNRIRVHPVHKVLHGYSPFRSSESRRRRVDFRLADRLNIEKDSLSAFESYRHRR